MNIKSICSFLCFTLFTSVGFSQAKFFNESQMRGESVNLAIGAVEIDTAYKFPKSVEVEPGTVVVLYEKYLDGKTSGRHRLITESDTSLVLRFHVAYAIVFSNPENDVMGFEEPNFGGQSLIFNKNHQEIPESFGLSSIYVPKGKKVKLYLTDPKEYPDQEIDHRPIAPGIRPYIGADIDDKVKFVVIE